MKLNVFVFSIVLFAAYDFAFGKPNNAPKAEDMRMWILNTYLNNGLYYDEDTEDTETETEKVPQIGTVSEESPEPLTEPPNNTDMNSFSEKSIFSGLLSRISIPLPFGGNNTIFGRIVNTFSKRLSTGNEILEYYIASLNQSVNDVIAGKTDPVTPLPTDSICWTFTKEATGKIQPTLIENGKDCIYQVLNVIRNEAANMEKLQLEFNKDFQGRYFRISLAIEIVQAIARMPYDGATMQQKFPSCELKQIKKSLETFADYITLFSRKCF